MENKRAMSDLIILIPGILGSVLKKDGKTAWGYSAATIGSALLTQGGSLRKALELPHDDPTLDDLGDGIVADGLMPDLHLLPRLWKIDGYNRIVQTPSENFDIVEGSNFFRFPYDWRRDNRVAARKLSRCAAIWLAAWRERSGKADAKLILVAHSMGGLVARRFLECLGGQTDTRALITFGTPFRGSLNTLDALANGVAKGPIDVSELVRQFTSVYQLLPIFPCFDSGDGVLARIAEASAVPNLDLEKAKAALEFHREIEAAVDARRKLGGNGGNAYRIHPVVGVAQDTYLSARRDGGGVAMSTTYRDRDFGGDGTVPRVSGSPIELGDDPADAVYVGTKHGSIQNADPVLQHVMGVLSGFDIPLGDFRRAPISVKLESPDILMSGERLAARATPARDCARLMLSVWSAADAGAVWSVEMRRERDGAFAGQTPPLTAGAYRVKIDGAGIESAEDSFAVLAASAP